MRDGKAFASLTSGLLARKGQARPAMRAQGFGFAAGKLDDLGWNDMGHDVPRPELTPLPPSPAAPPAPSPVRADATDFGRVEGSPVIRQQAEIAEALAAPIETPAAPVSAEPMPVEPMPVEPVAAAPVAAEPVPSAPVEAVIATPAAATPVAAKAKRARSAARPETTLAPVAAGRKAAFTLRIEADRHLRLRLACAVENRSAQQIVTAALDRFLASLPDVERLATSLSATSGRPE